LLNPIICCIFAAELISAYMIRRTIETQIASQLNGKKAITIMGARQVGKSTLLSMMLSKRDDVVWLSGDELDVQNMFSQITSTRLKAIIGNKSLLVIDEAQRIADIGLRIKLITDQLPGVQVIATGSSSFELSSKINEPLTGRKREFKLFPISFDEMKQCTSLLEELRMLPHRMVYGYYPEVVMNSGEERNILKELTDSYLYRDILAMDRVAKSDKLVALLQALAFQIGSQVSYNEISQLIGIDPKTIERYIDILEKSYVIFRLPCFSRNLRNELKNSRKIYFWDMGIRNSIISNWTPIENRQDVGAMWENFVIAERMKRNYYVQRYAQSYFWRTKSQQEIDYLEEIDGVLSAFEFKWNVKKSTVKCPASFLAGYPDTSYKVVTPENIEDFLA